MPSRVGNCCEQVVLVSIVVVGCDCSGVNKGGVIGGGMDCDGGMNDGMNSNRACCDDDDDDDDCCWMDMSVSEWHRFTP